MPASAPRHALGDHHVGPRYVVDLRDQPPDQFDDFSTKDWSALSWRDVGRPYRVEKWSRDKRDYERTHGEPLPVLERSEEHTSELSHT